MRHDELADLDATGQAQLVRDGEVSASELTEAAIQRIEALNPVVNAVNLPLFEEALERSTDGLLDGPFAGVPMLVKDIWSAELAGMPLAMGNRVLHDADFRAPHDTRLGVRFRDAGFVVVGRANAPEFSLVPTTQPAAFGPTRNPWALERTTGGSSGGSAAAVAAGMVPLAHGTDGGGSIRIPASCCGLVGLKPSRGRASLGRTAVGTSSGWLRSKTVAHVLTRSVRDCAAVLDVTWGNEPGDLFVLEAPKRAYVDELALDPGRLHIGLLATSPVGVDPICEQAATSTARLLESLGHHIELVDTTVLFPRGTPSPIGRAVAVVPPASRVSWRRAYFTVLESVLGRAPGPGDVEPWTWHALHDDGLSADQYAADLEQEQRYAQQISSWWSDPNRILLTPTLGTPPPLLADMEQDGDDIASYAANAFSRFGSFTNQLSIAGNPAISLPLHFTEDGLPIGVQLVAALGREDLLIRLASQLEAAAPWRDRRPAIGI